MENKEQELMFQLSMFEQQIQSIHQQIEAVERAIIDLSSLVLGLDDLKGSEGKEVLAPIGRGIFAKTKLISEKLLVDVGGKNLVVKDISSTQNIIKEQVKKLEEAREELNKALEEINKQLTELILSAQKGKE